MHLVCYKHVFASNNHLHEEHLLHAISFSSLKKQYKKYTTTKSLLSQNCSIGRSQFINLLHAIELSLLVNKSCNIDVTMSRRHPHSRIWRTTILNTSNGYVSRKTKQLYRLGSRTTAFLFDPRTNLLPSAFGFGQQQISSRVK